MPTTSWDHRAAGRCQQQVRGQAGRQADLRLDPPVSQSGNRSCESVCSSTDSSPRPCLLAEAGLQGLMASLFRHALQRCQGACLLSGLGETHTADLGLMHDVALRLGPAVLAPPPQQEEGEESLLSSFCLPALMSTLARRPSSPALPLLAELLTMAQLCQPPPTTHDSSSSSPWLSVVGGVAQAGMGPLLTVLRAVVSAHQAMHHKEEATGGSAPTACHEHSIWCPADHRLPSFADLCHVAIHGRSSCCCWWWSPVVPAVLGAGAHGGLSLLLLRRSWQRLSPAPPALLPQHCQRACVLPEPGAECGAARLGRRLLPRDAHPGLAQRRGARGTDPRTHNHKQQQRRAAGGGGVEGGDEDGGAGGGLPEAGAQGRCRGQGRTTTGNHQHHHNKREGGGGERGLR